MKMKIFLPMLLVMAVLSGFQISAQTELPVVTVRFANPHVDCPTRTYCVDVEFMANIPDQQLFGMNVRFFYDDHILEYISMGEFQAGYGSPDQPLIETGTEGSGGAFGIAGPLEFFNGTVQLLSPSTIYLTTSWTKLFNICFHVDDDDALDLDNFCPSIIWDLQADPGSGGYLQGDDGVVMTVVAPQGSSPTIENVIQFNWQYDPSGNLIGFPVNITCISTKCSYVIPLSNWSLFLGIGLMLISSVFIYRKRMYS
jgi:hypothetical protein